MKLETKNYQQKTTNDAKLYLDHVGGLGKYPVRHC